MDAGIWRRLDQNASPLGSNLRHFSPRGEASSGEASKIEKNHKSTKNVGHFHAMAQQEIGFCCCALMLLLGRESCVDTWESWFPIGWLSRKLDFWPIGEDLSSSPIGRESNFLLSQPIGTQDYSLSPSSTRA